MASNPEEVSAAERARLEAKRVPIGLVPVPDLRGMLAGPLGDIESPIEAEWEAAFAVAPGPRFDTAQ